MVAGLDRVPVELGLYLRAVRGDVVVAGTLGLTLYEVPVHRFGERSLVAILLSDEVSNATHLILQEPSE